MEEFRSGSFDVVLCLETIEHLLEPRTAAHEMETLVAIPWPGRPRNLREVLWKLFRRLLWDRIVIYKR